MRKPLVGRRGVTLTEIVVVIAIIMMLASLSFYAFSSAKTFADRTEHATQLAVTRVHRNADNLSRGLLPRPVATPESRPAQPLMDRVAGHYFVGFGPSVRNLEAEAQRLASLVGGRVIGIYRHGVWGCGLACADNNARLLAADPVVVKVDQARAIYLCQAPKNIQRVFSNGINGQTATAPVNKMFGAPPAVYRLLRQPAAPGVVGTRVYLSGSSTASVAVAVMDSGIDYRHPDLNVVYNQDFTGLNNPMDMGGHGTHVAGVVGAVDRTATGGVVGVYPGAPLLNLKVINSGDPKIVGWSQVINVGSLAVYGALDYVIANAAAIPVCLMPFHTATGDPTMDALVNAAAERGVIMIATAGQNGGGANRNLDVTPTSPGSAAGAITVAGMDDDDALPGRFGGASDDIYGNGPLSFSNYGSVVAFVAPTGAAYGGIQSTIPLQGQVSNGLAQPYSKFLYGSPVPPSANGQSFSCAHVAGMMALLKDPQTTLGFSLGGRGITSYRPQMRNREEAVAALYNATHQLTPFQMINPLTGSAYTLTGFPPTAMPYRKALYNDFVIDPLGRRIPVANFYANPNQPPAFLAPFPG